MGLFGFGKKKEAEEKRKAEEAAAAEAKRRAEAERAKAAPKPATQTTDDARAREVFRTACKALDTMEWRYQKNEDKMSIECSAQGDDLPMDLSLEVDAERQIVVLLSRLPLTFPKDKLVDGVLAVSAINNTLSDGSFDYNVQNGHVIFRMTNSFKDSTLGEAVIHYLVLCSCKVINEFAAKLLMLSKGMLTFEKFMENLNNE